MQAVRTPRATLAVVHRFSIRSDNRLVQATALLRKRLAEAEQSQAAPQAC